MAAVARLTPVDLREVWPNEAADFTPWLADNLDVLGEALGIDLELERQEAPVGPFSVDILAKDANGNRMVVIENQLGGTNHDHLGKVLTYAAGYDAAVMVWIVRNFQDEHRDALDWLNRRTGEETEFYGVVVRAVRIEGSSPAPVFDVVARPSTFSKASANRATGSQPSPTGEAYRAFWQPIVDRLRDDHNLTRATKAGSGNWMNFPTGVSGVVYGVVYSKKGARTELYLNHHDRRRNKALFDRLHNGEGGVEAAFGEPFEWERLSNYKSSRIAIYLPGRAISDNEDTLSGTADWMVSSIVKLSQTVIPIVNAVAATVNHDLATESSVEPPDLDIEEDGE